MKLLLILAAMLCCAGCGDTPHGDPKAAAALRAMEDEAARAEITERIEAMTIADYKPRLEEVKEELRARAEKKQAGSTDLLVFEATLLQEKLDWLAAYFKKARSDKAAYDAEKAQYEKEIQEMRDRK